MKAAGIVAEYNPVHNGHIYCIREAGRISHADAVIVAMSGNYVQRGEPALIDKWTRASHALACGADLVIEIPVLYCLADAGRYAGAGVKLLEATGKVSHIAFGSECGDTDMLRTAAENLAKHRGKINERIKIYAREGLSYPAARQKAYEEIITGNDSSKILRTPNDILALEYIMSAHTAEPLAIRRIGSGYNDAVNHENCYQSAAALRSHIINGGDIEDISSYVPECTVDSLGTCHLTGFETDKWFDTLRYAILAASEEMIEDCPSGGEGLANRMKSSVRTAGSYREFISSVQTKRYTSTRISRLCMQIILGITRSSYPAKDPLYIRVLGFNSNGRKLLFEMRSDGSATLPLITNINKESHKLDSEALKLLKLEKHASDIYNLMTGRDIKGESDSVKKPVLATF